MVKKVLSLVLLVLLACAWWWAESATTDSEPSAQPTATTSATPTPGTSGAGSTADDLRGLPPQVRETLALVDAGGPFPYRRDGVVFENRERRLPQQPRGYWHEYTVPTPGESDRGARRLVVGRAGEVYYSGDHYRTFRLIRPGDERRAS